MRRIVPAAIVCLVAVLPSGVSLEPRLRAQQSTVLQFETISIRRSDPDADNGWLRTEPDGTFVMENTSIRGIIKVAVAAPVSDVVGLPEWATRDRYVIRAKPPTGATAEQKTDMWRALFAEHMKLVTHVENQERDTYALVISGADGRLGPRLRPSTIDCDPRGAAQRSPEARARCGGIEGGGALGGWIRSPGMPIEALAAYLSGMLGGRVVDDRTGLQGLHAVDWSWSRAATEVYSRPAREQAIYSATEEQLGLKLLPERTTVPILIIDHIERPTEN